MTTTPKFAIVNDIDAPQPSLVCQWVPGVGYCYLDRRAGKANHDGMHPTKPTPIEAFGFNVTQDEGRVRFQLLDDLEVTATYADGRPRRWQSRVTSFSYALLTPGKVLRKTKKAAAA